MIERCSRIKDEDRGKWTPGPWKIQDLGEKPGYPDWHTYAIRDAKTNVCLAIVGNVDRYFEKTNEINAHLMNASPELADACQAIADLANGQGRMNMLEVAGMANAALDKARG